MGRNVGKCHEEVGEEMIKGGAAKNRLESVPQEENMQGHGSEKKTVGSPPSPQNQGC